MNFVTYNVIRFQNVLFLHANAFALNVKVYNINLFSLSVASPPPILIFTFEPVKCKLIRLKRIAR